MKKHFNITLEILNDLVLNPPTLFQGYNKSIPIFFSFVTSKKELVPILQRA